MGPFSAHQCMVEDAVKHGAKHLDSAYPGTITHTLQGGGPGSRNLTVIVQRDTHVVKTVIDHSKPLHASRSRLTQAEP